VKDVDSHGLAPQPHGGQGDVVFNPHHVRAEARILSLGVISEEQSAALLRGAAKLAANAVNQNRPRDYAAAMKVMLAAAKLELEHAGLERLVNQIEQQAPLKMTDAMRRTSLLAIIAKLRLRAPIATDAVN
jgi:hypothetical protein